MHLTIFLFNLMGLMWYAGGSRFWGVGSWRGWDGVVSFLGSLYLISYIVFTTS